jgi:VCBS repeat-containing protein
MPAKTTVRVALINNAAKDDFFSGDALDWLDEDGSLAGSLNVLGNDPGSATLYSVSDTVPTGTGTMLPQACDTFTVTHDGTTYTGKLKINADGTVGFDLSSMQGKIDSLAEGETIAVDFYYTAKMANGVLSTAKVTVEITGENDAPEVSIADQSVDEDTAWTFTLPSDAVTDAEGDPLTVTATLADGTALPGWLTFDADTLTFSGTPPLNFNGTIDIMVSASDGSLSGSDTFTLTINAVNDAPALTGTAATLANGTEDTNYTVSAADLLAGFTDVEGDALSVENLAADHGTVTDNGDGTFTIELDANYNGPIALSYDVSDGTDTTAATQAFTVDAVNDAPTTTLVTLAAIAEDSAAVTITQADLLANAADIEGDALTATGLALVGGGSLTDNGDGTWDFTPAANDDTGVSFTYTIEDGNGGTAAGTASLDLTPMADAPPLPPAVVATSTGDPNDFDASGVTGSQTISGGPGDNTLYGGAGSDTINGGNGNDAIYGGSGNDGLNGNNDVDQLYGGSGEDVLQGSGAVDTLVGGWSADRLVGGALSDTFKFLSNDDRGDYIEDFAAGEKIDVSALNSTHFSGGAEAFGLWHYGTGSTTVQGTVYSGEVYAADTDGNAATIEFWFVMNSSTPALGASDFLF